MLGVFSRYLAGWILDGYPTTVTQAQALEEVVGGAGALDAALRHGYADQAHFSREARALFERPPAALKAHTQRPGDDADWLLRRS